VQTPDTPGRVPAAYGLAVDGDVAVPGLARAAPAALRGRVELSSADAWADAGGEAELLFSQPDALGGEAVRLERSRAGYRIHIAGVADFAVAADGMRLDCRAGSAPAWRWQRLLAGHALPMAALLQGIEVLHAGAVALDVAGRRVAVAVAAGSHGGKSSLSINLALRGAGLITDDALAVEVTGDERVLAHPGLGAATLRTAEVEQLRRLGLADGLHVIGEDADAVRVLLEPEDAPLPLAAIYWPERDPSLTRARFTRLAPEPRRLLTGTINLVLLDPARQRRHFDVSTTIAARVPLFRIGVPAAVGAAALAAEIEAHARGLAK
jgi:hypothetical protein